MKVSVYPVCPVCDRRAHPLKEYPAWLTCAGCRTLSEAPTRGDFPATVLAPGAAVLRAIEKLTALRDAEDPAARLEEFRELAKSTPAVMALPPVSALARGLRLRAATNLHLPAGRTGVQPLTRFDGRVSELPEGGILRGRGSMIVTRRTPLAATGTTPGLLVTALPHPGPDFTAWGEMTALAVAPDDVEPA